MCHGNNLNSGPGSFNISSDIPITGFVPGETYTITIQGSHPSFNKYGFELTAESLGIKVGGFNITNSSQTKLINNNNSVTHKNTGTLGSTLKKHGQLIGQNQLQEIIQLIFLLGITMQMEME